MGKGKIVIFSAPSGAGKTTIVRHLLANNKSLTFSISATTRERRHNETDKVDYYFLTVDNFREKLSRNEFVEYEEVYDGLYYGTLRTEIERIWKEGKHVIVDVDVKGGLNLKKAFGDKALAIFVKPPSIEVLIERLTFRKTESEESLRKRTDKAEYELSFEKYFDKVLVNNSLELAFENAQKLVDEFLAS
ncbi:MAG: guanylate kinase [Flammeovirgaceae bacterium]|nr:guanylate kinase [Flammeovirgaceae bacterium]